jgi:sugar (pentulose or hexulose) kinase
VASLRQAVTGAGERDIRALGVSSQGGALQRLEAGRRPAGPVISWLDARGGPWDTANNRRLGAGWFGARIGHCGSGLAIGQLQRLSGAAPVGAGAPGIRHEPALTPSLSRPTGEGARRAGEGFMLPARGGLSASSALAVGFVGDLVVERLCGQPAHDATSAGLTLLFNPQEGRYDPDVLALSGVTAAQLPPVLPATRPAGGLLESVAAAVGLRAGIPVSVAIHDQYASALGVGAVHAGQVMFGAGTAWVLLAVSDRWLEPVTEAAYAAYHVVSGLTGQILSLHNGGSAVSWAAGLTSEGGGEVALDDRLERTAPGANGVRFAPFLAGTPPFGIRPGASGMLTGLRLEHGPEHLLRAVVEGLSFELRRHLDRLRDAGCRPRALLMSGSAAASRVTPQIIADVTGLPVACATESESSACGAAILARHLVEPGSDLAQLADAMKSPARPVAPGPAEAVYQAAFAAYLDWLESIGTLQPSAA